MSDPAIRRRLQELAQERAQLEGSGFGKFVKGVNKAAKETGFASKAALLSGNPAAAAALASQGYGLEGGSKHSRQFLEKYYNDNAGAQNFQMHAPRVTSKWIQRPTKGNPAGIPNPSYRPSAYQQFVASNRAEGIASAKLPVNKAAVAALASEKGVTIPQAQNMYAMKLIANYWNQLGRSKKSNLIDLSGSGYDDYDDEDY